MFHPEPSLTWVPATKEQVVAIIEGINQPQVSLPGRPPQTVTGHLCALRNASGTFSIYVALHVPRTGENFVYVHDRRQVSLEEYRDVEIEGLQFLESMGFMLDNLNFRNLSAEMQEQTVRRIPLFGGRPAPAPASAPGPARTSHGMPAATPPGAPPRGPAFAAVGSGVLTPATPIPAAPPALAPRETAALARLLASF